MATDSGVGNQGSTATSAKGDVGLGTSIRDLNFAIWQSEDGARSSDGKGSSQGFSDFQSPGAIITQSWPYVFGLAGLVLFVMLVWGSMEIMFGAGDPKSAENGKKRITYAVLGFVLLFASFWIAQIIERVFGLSLGLGSGL